MSTPSIDPLLQITAPVGKPPAARSPREDESSFANYLHEATSATGESSSTSPTKQAPTKAKTIVEDEPTTATGEQDTNTASDNETPEAIDVVELGEDNTTLTVEATSVDEVLLSEAASTILVAAVDVEQVTSIVAETNIAPTAPTTNVAQLPPTISQTTPPTDTLSLLAEQNLVDAPLQAEVEDAPETVASTLAETESVVPSTVALEVETTVAATEQPALVNQGIPQKKQQTPSKHSQAVVETPLTDTTTVAAPAPVEEAQSETLPESTAKAVESAPRPEPTANNVEIVAATSPEPAQAAEATEFKVETDVVDKIAGKPSQESVAPTPTASSVHASAETSAQTPTFSEPTAAQAPRGEAEPSLSTIDRARFVQRVANAFRSAQQDEGHIQLRLSPPELGSLRIEIAVRNGVLSANLETETADARRVLLDNLPALRQRLAEQDIRIEKFEVDIRREGGESAGQAGAQDRQAEQQSQRATAQNRIRTPQPTEVISARIPRGQTMPTDVGLDVRI